MSHKNGHHSDLGREKQVPTVFLTFMKSGKRTSHVSWVIFFIEIPGVRHVFGRRSMYVDAPPKRVSWLMKIVLLDGRTKRSTNGILASRYNVWKFHDNDKWERLTFGLNKNPFHSRNMFASCQDIGCVRDYANMPTNKNSYIRKIMNYYELWIIQTPNYENHFCKTLCKTRSKKDSLSIVRTFFGV